MHSTKELSTSSFSVTVAGRRGGLADVFPGFSERDRLGVVVRRPCGALGASILILAAVTAFYDAQRRRGEDFFIYPDYFVFHTGRPLGDHRRLEIWPSQKEVVVPDEPEALLRSINDRGVTRLLVEDGEPGDPALAAETLASARSRITTTLAYARDGRVRRADVELTGNAVTESYVSGVLEQSAGVPPDLHAEIAAARHALLRSGRPVETYHAVGLAEALGLLAAPRAVVT